MAELFSQVLDLKKKDVFLETKDNDTKYFSITGLPSTLSYGKHPFSITFNDPEGEPLLKNLSNIVFEFVDSRGTVIFSNLIDIEELSGAGNGFIWIKKDPLRTADEIADGPAFLNVMGELGGKEIPKEWQGIYNVRTSFTYDIRKDFPNTSPLVLAKPSSIQTNLSISETVEFDDSDTVYKRSFINVTLSDLETNGGKIESVELAYNEQKSKTDDFDVITSYPLTSGSFETDSQTLTSGLNPITNTTKIPTPKTFRRNTPVKFRLRFLSPSKQLAQYLDKDRQGEIVEVTSSFITFDSAPFFVEKTDNLLTGSLSVGRAVGKGFTFSGKKSAELSTVDYKGFTSASLGLGPGILMYSGSVKDDITDDYALGGVGLELVANSESFFRFRTNPSELDIRTNKFFIGSETSQFISASSGNIEISSSKFHLKADGDIIVRKINADEGTIASFTIDENGLTGNSDSINATSSIDDTTINLISKVANSSGEFDTNGAKTVQRLTKIEAGKVTEASAIHYKGLGDFDDPSSAGLSSAWIGAYRAMKEDLGWFQDTYLNYNFANTGKYSFIQIQIDTGSGEYNRYNNPLHGGDHGSSGIHLGTGAAFQVTAQAPLGGNYNGNTHLSLFANGNISSSAISTASFGHLMVGGGNFSSASLAAGGSGISDVVDDTSPQLGGNLDLNSNDITGTGNINITGNISASSYVYAGDRVYVNNDLTLSHDGSSQLSVGFDSTYDKIRYGKDSDVIHNFLGAKISGSVISTGSFGHLMVGGGNFSSASLAAGGSGISNVVEDTSPQLGGDLDLNSNDITGTGNIDIVGNITAQNFIVSSSVTSIEYQSLSGSTIFGDDSGDTHQFTGSINISGSLNVNDGDLIVTDSVDIEGDIDVNGTTNLDAVDIDGTVQIDGNTSFGVDGTGVDVILYGDTANRRVLWDQSADQMKFFDNTKLTFGTGVADSDSDAQIYYDGSNLRLVNEGGVISLEDDVNVIGNVSGSATSTGSFGLVLGDGSQLTNLPASFTSAGISGSFTDVSSSLAGRITTEEGNVDTLQGRTLTAGDGLTGGGTLASDRTFNVVGGTGITANANDIATNDSEIVHDNLSGFVANEHKDHSAITITAGDGLTGGGTIVSTRTLAVGAGTGIDVAADAISVDVSDFMANGSNNRILTSATTDTINAEANLTFDGTTLSGSAASTSSFGAGYIDNKLGVGTVNPKAPIHIFEDNYSTVMADPIEDTRLFVSDIDGGSHIGIQSKNDNSGSIYFGHRTEIEAAKIVWDNSTDTMNFYSGSTKMFEYGEGNVFKFYKQINTVSSIVTLGGIHVGSTSDPGNDNLTVDGIISGSIYDSINVEGTVSASGHGYFGGRVHLFGAIAVGRESGTDELNVGYDNSYNSIQYGKPAGTIHKFAGTMISGSVNSTGSFGQLVLVGDRITSPLNVTFNNGINVGKNISGSANYTGSFGHLMVGGGNFSSASLAAGGSSDDLSWNDGTATTISGSATSTGSFGKQFLGNGNTSQTTAALQIKQTSNTSVHGIYLERNGETKGGFVGIGSIGITGHGTLQDGLVLSSQNASTRYDRFIIDRSGEVGIEKIKLGTMISGSSTSTGSFGRVKATKLVGNGSGITNLSISEISPEGSDGEIQFNDGGSFNATSNFKLTDANSADVALKINGPIEITRAGSGISGSSTSTGSFGHLLVGGSELTSSPDATDGSQSTISGSATSTGSFGQLILSSAKIVTNSPVNFNQGLDVTKTITVGGNIIGDGATQIKDMAVISGSATSTGSFGSLETAGNSIFTGTLTANAGVKVDNITIDGTEIDLSSGNLTLDVAGNIVLDTGGDINLLKSGTQFGQFKESSSDFIIKSNINNKDMIFQGVDGGGAITALTLDMSEGGRAIFLSDVSGSAVGTGSFGHGHIANNLGIGTTSPVRMLDIVGAGAAIKVDSSDHAYIELDRGATGNLSQVKYLTAGSANWYAGLTDSDVSGFDGTEFFIGEGSGGASDAHFVIDGSGNVTLGSGVALEFGDSNTKILGSSANNYLSFTPGGTELLKLVGTSISGSAISTGSFGAGYIDNKLGIGIASPSNIFHAYGNVSSAYVALVENDQATSGHGLQVHSDGNGSGTILFDVDAAGSSRFRVRGDGSVLVGFTTSQDEKLAVNGDFKATGNISGSSTSTGSFGSGYFDKTLYVGTKTHTNRALKIHGTSGDISAEISNDATSNAFLRFSTDLDGTHRSGIIGMDYSDNVLRINHGGSFDGVNNGMAINSSGDIGVGADPIVTHSALTQLTLGGNSFISFDTAAGASKALRISQNSRLNSSGNTQYISEDQASMYTQKDGTHLFQVVGSGTGVINTSFIDALLIDNSGNSIFSGNISGSATSTGSFGRVEATKLVGDGSGITGVTGEWDGTRTGNAVITGDFIVKGSDPLISSSISGRTVKLGDVVGGENQTSFVVDDEAALIYMPDTSGGQKFGIGTSSPGVALEVIGDISGSSTSTGSFGHLMVGGSELTSSPDATDGSQSTISGSANSTGSFGRLFLGSGKIITDANNVFTNNGLDVTKTITVGGNIIGDGATEVKDMALISGSAISTGSFGAGYIDNKLGIGTTSPSFPLEITNGQDGEIAAIMLHNTDTGADDNVAIHFRPANLGAAKIVADAPGGSDVNFEFHTINSGGAGGIFYMTGDGNLILPGDITLPDAGNINTGTTDGSDNKELYIAGGGDVGVTRGAYIQLSGNEDANTGRLLLRGGGVSGATIDFSAKNTGASQMILDASGNLELTEGNISGSATSTGSFGSLVVIGNQTITGTTTYEGDLVPNSDNSSNLGSASLRWADVFAVQTTTGGVFETGLRTKKIGDNPTGTIVSWEEDGLVPCDKNEDELVMGVIKKGKDEPIVLGAEPVLVTGKVNVGDYIVTSNKIGHGKSVKRGYLLKKNLFGKVIAQALESCDGDSNLIKCMIRKM